MRRDEKNGRRQCPYTWRHIDRATPLPIIQRACPESVRPERSVMVPEIMSGSRTTGGRPFAAASASLQRRGGGACVA